MKQEKYTIRVKLKYDEGIVILCEELRNKEGCIFSNLDTIILVGWGKSKPSIRHLCARYVIYLDVYIAHRTTGCFDDRLLTMMTDTGLYVP